MGNDETSEVTTTTTVVEEETDPEKGDDQSWHADVQSMLDNLLERQKAIESQLETLINRLPKVQPTEPPAQPSQMTAQSTQAETRPSEPEPQASTPLEPNQAQVLTIEAASTPDLRSRRRRPRRIGGKLRRG